ncbi:MAG: MFS transporter [Syntrophaceae bacterium]|nr:MFS transporter [Syntrophaceae bacterium]
MSQPPRKPFLSQAGLFALGHFINDLYPAFLPPLLPLLVEKFQLTFTRAGVLATVLSFSASLTQPLFGYLADRLGGRTLILLGPLVCGVSLSFIGAVHHYPLLVFLLILGGMGGAAFHPEAAAMAASLSRGKRTLGMSIFMLGGNAGYGLGPFLILPVVSNLGLNWSFLSCLPALGLVWLLYRYAPRGEKLVAPSSASLPSVGQQMRRRLSRFGLLLGVVVLRVTAVLSLTTFLPTFQKLRGFSLLAAGSSFTVFMVCGALGGLIGGILADRVGRKKMIIASSALVLPAFLAFLVWKGPASFIILSLLGFLFFLSESACIVLAQEMAPGKARTVSGIIMGMAWGLAGFGVLGTGALADALGIEGAMGFLLLLPAGSLLISLFLPGAQDQSVPR